MSLFKQHKKLIWFLGRACFLLLLWLIAYEGFIKDWGVIDDWLTEMVADHGIKLLSFFTDGYTYQKTTYGDMVFYNGNRILSIAHSCNGLVVYALFLGFMLSFSTPIKPKVVISLIGVLGIYFLNISRVAALCAIQVNAHEFLDFSHKYLFTLIIYSFVFYLWWILIEKYSDFGTARK